MNLSRRGFLIGSSAGVAAAIVPMLPIEPWLTADMVKIAASARPSIRPGSLNYYVMYAHPEVVRDLRAASFPLQQGMFLVEELLPIPKIAA